MTPVVLTLAAVLAGGLPVVAAPGFSLPDALRAALADPSAKLTVEDVRGSVWPSGCRAVSAQAERPIAASGRYAVRLAGANAEGAPCQGWAWASVKVLASVRVAARELRPGEPLAGATLLAERELVAGRSPVLEIPEGSVATRLLRAGQIIEQHHLRAAGTSPGEPVVVLARSGTVSIVQPGRMVPCVRGRACAVLPSGRRVVGQLEGGRLVVEAP
ncbi:MAG: hypothetical protein HY901_02480 [Deltaproteobacteria bacterium]|nr:hypothetical protein [Deltaproteobacteria bacterium]